MKKKIFFKPKISPWSLSVVFLGLALGFAVTLQIRSSTARIANPLLPYASLRDTKESLLQENEKLSQESALLQKEISQLQEEIKRSQTLDEAKSAELTLLKQKTGLLEVEGSGVEIILNDAPEFRDGSSSIAHAADLRDLVNVLWEAGATAIAINNQRIVGTTSIDCIVNTVMINNVRTVPPFRILALGERQKLENALRDQNKLEHIYERTVKTGLIFQFQFKRNLKLPPFGGNFIVEKARVL